MATSDSTWKAFEREIAKDIGGKRVYGSGSIKDPDAKLYGDAKGLKLLVEAKLRDIPSKKRNAGDRKPSRIIKFKLSWLDQAIKEAKLAKKRYGCLVVRNKYAKKEDAVVVVKKRTFNALVKKADLLVLGASKTLDIKNRKKNDKTPAKSMSFDLDIFNAFNGVDNSALTDEKAVNFVDLYNKYDKKSNRVIVMKYFHFLKLANKAEIIKSPASIMDILDDRL